jgi:aminopeptidase N
MKKLIVGVILLNFLIARSQITDATNSENWKNIYRSAATKINDLLNTKLDLRFDYAKSHMYGKAWITLHPHFFPTDSLNLDAKGMAIEEIALVSQGKNVPLHYSYDSMNLRIVLNRTYRANENYTVYIKYISRPNEFAAVSAYLIPGEKGLYFINPLGEIKDKPVQIWTQGETEANSYWFPTIDKPNQKTTDEISMTVPSKYLTLSNGLLVSQKKNADGTRTDTWKMSLPHAPYLLFMGVGDYSIIRDSYKGKEVSYYVEKEYAPVARKIFGNTPEMISFFSRITGVDYPWPKYAQIVGRDYIFGAMENTSVTLHEESTQQDARQLLDGNIWEETIAHELFHQWFGDYVTTESWSNITCNESFADYSQTLWNEHKHGKDAGGESIYSDLRNYLGDSANAEKPLVRFYYQNVIEAFDAVSYQKGGCILNMLRNYVGDSAFFKSLNLYLSAHKFKSAEAQDLRLAFEEITGQDLNWFWNQWYYGTGHPKLDISYDYDASNKTAKVYINQTQHGHIFRFPLAIDVYQETGKERYKVWMNQQADTFSFASATKPSLINVDGDKVLVCEKTDHKTMENFIYQYKNAGLYVDRREAIAYCAKLQDDPNALEFLKKALYDEYDGLRKFTLSRLDLTKDSIRKAVAPILTDLAKNDSKTLVRARAIGLLGQYKQISFKPLFVNAISDSSYSVAGNALEALAKIDSVTAVIMAKLMSLQPARGELETAILDLFSSYGDESTYPYIYNQFIHASTNTKFNTVESLSKIVAKSKNTEQVKRGIDLIVNFRDELTPFQRQFGDGFINGFLNNILAAKQAAGLTDQADYVKSKLPPTDK